MLYDPAPPKATGRTAPSMILPGIFGHCVCEMDLWGSTPGPSLLTSRGNFNREQNTQGLQNQEVINPLSLSHAHILFPIHWYRNLQLLCFYSIFCFFFSCGLRHVSKIEYYMHVFKAFHDQEFKRKMWTEAGERILGGNNSIFTE